MLARSEHERLCALNTRPRLVHVEVLRDMMRRAEDLPVDVARDSAFRRLWCERRIVAPPLIDRAIARHECLAEQGDVSVERMALHAASFFTLWLSLVAV